VLAEEVFAAGMAGGARAYEDAAGGVGTDAGEDAGIDALCLYAAAHCAREDIESGENWGAGESDSGALAEGEVGTFTPVGSLPKVDSSVSITEEEEERRKVGNFGMVMLGINEPEEEEAAARSSARACDCISKKVSSFSKSSALSRASSSASSIETETGCTVIAAASKFLASVTI